MNLNTKKKKPIAKNIFILFVSIIILNILINPSMGIKSAKEGIDIWFNILLPSLFPFFVLSNLLIELGFINILGKFLNPIILPVFNISGQGIFPVIMSIMSGYPVGAKLTSQIREKNLISKLEGDRLIAFASTSGPLFILGSVLIGMLNSPDLKLLMIMPHYLGTITLALIFRFYKSGLKDREFKNNKKPKSEYQNIGIAVSNSIKDSLESIITIGGFVIIYLVIINTILSMNFINYIILNLSNYLNLNPNILEGLFAGIIEITVGCQKIASLNIALIQKIIIINFIIGWGGFSIHSQALSFINKTDINSNIYFFAKFFHGIFASIYTYIIYILRYKSTNTFLVFNENTILNLAGSYNFLEVLFYSIKISILTILFTFIFSIIINQFVNKRGVN